MGRASEAAQKSSACASDAEYAAALRSAPHYASSDPPATRATRARRWHQGLANLVALTAIQASNAVMPLFIFPFVLRVVGSGPYSRIVVSETFGMVLLTIVLYSFEVDGVAEVVASRNVGRLDEVFSKIFWLRVLLFVTAAPVIIAIAALTDSTLIGPTLCWMLVPLSHVLQQSWLFLGLRRNVPLALFVVTSRVATVALILIFVNTTANYMLVPLIVGLTSLAASLCAWIYALYRFPIRLRRVRWPQLKGSLWAGKEVFLGNLSVTLYRDINVVILGVLGSSDLSVATYSLAEKVLKGFQASIRPLNQLFFPRALQVAQEATAPGKAVLGRLLRLTWPQVGALGLLAATLGAAFLCTEDSLRALGGATDPRPVAALVAVMTCGAFFGVFNFMLGMAGLNALGARRYLLLATLTTGVVSVVICACLAFRFEAFGAALTFSLAEGMLLWIIVRKYLETPSEKLRVSQN